MTYDEICRHKKDYGDSPVWSRGVPLTSSLFEGCSHATLAAKTACISNTRHSLEAPLQVESGVLASPAKCMPRDPAPAVPRVADATFIAASLGISRAASTEMGVVQFSA
jgi:hypothetical protein